MTPTYKVTPTPKEFYLLMVKYPQWLLLSFCQKLLLGLPKNWNSYRYSMTLESLSFSHREGTVFILWLFRAESALLEVQAVCDHFPWRTLAEGKGNVSAKRALISKQKRLTFFQAEDAFSAKTPRVLFPPVALFQAHLVLYWISPFFLKWMILAHFLTFDASLLVLSVNEQVAGRIWEEGEGEKLHKDRDCIGCQENWPESLHSKNLPGTKAAGWEGLRIGMCWPCEQPQTRGHPPALRGVSRQRSPCKDCTGPLLRVGSCCSVLGTARPPVSSCSSWGLAGTNSPSTSTEGKPAGADPCASDPNRLALPLLHHPWVIRLVPTAAAGQRCALAYALVYASILITEEIEYVSDSLTWDPEQIL